MNYTRQLHDRIMPWEGGYQNHPEDSGNVNACGQRVGTNRGITSRTVETLMGIRCPDEAFMRGITDEYAYEVLTRFWDFYRIDEISDQSVADLAMNCFMGLPREAARSIQKAANRYQARLEEDGIMGSKTLAALNSLIRQDRNGIFNAILDEWLNYLGTTNPTFRQGLLNRTNALFQPLAGGAVAAAPVATVGVTDEAVHVVKGAFKGKRKDLISVITVLVGLAMAVVSVAWLVRSRRQLLPA
jgi:lysozyme family protein